MLAATMSDCYMCAVFFGLHPHCVLHKVTDGGEGIISGARLGMFRKPGVGGRDEPMCQAMYNILGKISKVKKAELVKRKGRYFNTREIRFPGSRCLIVLICFVSSVMVWTTVDAVQSKKYDVASVAY